MAQFIVTTTTDVVDGSDGVLSLREALAQADSTAGDDEIGFAMPVQGQSIVLAGGQLTAACNGEIFGGIGVTIDANGQSRVLEPQGANNRVTLDHLTLTGGAVDGDEGGGTLANAELRLDSATVAAPVREANEGFAIALAAPDDPSGDGTILTVTTAVDVVDASDGVISLREALTLAAGVPGADQIEFAAAVQGQTITLTMGQLTVTSDVIIDGGFGGVTIDAAQRSRVFEVDGTSTDATFAYLTVTGGRTTAGGGGIYAFDSTVTVCGCTIADNQTVGDDFHNNGGGILTRIGRTIISNSTIHGNSAAYLGGGLYASHCTIENSTITGNSAQGPTGGGGFYGSGTIDNSIIAGNAGNYADGNMVGVGWYSEGGNVFGGSLRRSLSNDFQNIDPRTIFQDTYVLPGTSVHAGVLAANYGPTPTVALLDIAANPALGGADPTFSSIFDQRGVPRPQPDGTQPDIGAFELRQTPPLVGGSARSEHLFGTRHDDLMQGGDGNDRIHGGRSGDRLEGGDGKDRLFGDGGGDLLLGGADADRFIFACARDSMGLRRNLVLDFSQEDADRIDLRRLDADAHLPGDQRLCFIGTKPFEASGQVRYVSEAGRTVVEVNLDHDRHAELQIELQPSLELQRADFVL